MGYSVHGTNLVRPGGQMIDISKAQVELRQIIGRIVPSANIARIDIQPATDSSGEPSFRIRVVLKGRLGKEAMRKIGTVVDEFRTWLAKQDDERFPYFDFITEQDELDLLKTDP
jgi:hypothetical protein